MAEGAGLLSRGRVVLGSLPRAWEMRRSRPAADRELRAIARGSRPIVAGPWTGEVGFELLYWIPLLRWLVEERGVDPARIVAVSRGGADPWYADVAGRYLDVLDVATPGQLRDALGQPGEQKRRRPNAFDREILERLGAQIGERRYSLLHPGVMYGLFRRFWTRRGEGGASDVGSRARFARLPDPGRPPVGLPKRYVALKAYFSNVFPDTPENREQVRAMTRGLAARGHVVLLSAGVAIDDHPDAFAPTGSRVHPVTPLLDARHNLSVQSRAVAGADALVSTYGGFSYLGPLLGVPSHGFVTDDVHNPAHAAVMERALGDLADGGEPPGFTIGSPQEAVDAIGRSLPMRP